MCRHNVVCADPGVQQVRLVAGGLELGFVDSAPYIAALAGGPWPPTRFPSGEVEGAERQRELGMTDRAALLAEMRSGTS